MAVEEVDIAALETALEAGALLIDVREPNEYAAGHVSGAILVPLGTVPQEVQQFVDDRPVYIICRSGARSMRAAEYLEGQDIVTFNVAGGTLAWINSGRPTVAGDQPA